MDVTKKKLAEAADKNIISNQQAERLYEFLAAQSQDVPRFSFTHVLYYLGGLIAIGAMTVFMNLGWESFGGPGIVAISIVYAVIGLKVTNSFAAKNLVIPAGICAAFVVCLTPLAIYGFQQWLGVWPDESVYRDYHRYIKWHWLYMELGTLAVGIIIAWKYKYPFLIMPIAVTLWYMTMDITAMISGGDVSWELRKLVSLFSGLLMIGLAFWVDIRSHKKADYAFWIYIFGVLAFWGGLSLQSSDSELSKFIYFCINLLMIGVGVLLVRRVFVVFGAIGSACYLGYLAFDVFEDSWLFPIALTVVGLGIIYLGILWQKHEKTITQKSRSLLPAPLREMLEAKS
ncbi:DUF2157 domain-containing protein [Pseudidiomarina sp. 1APP75-32.1]|uniref:DUF2157 domain-containing protein n=1 Tax=Pseudidiomarina terrestris TaxID=2820060 RepID=A0AAW7R4A9_9GAMM|nr:MULTISPECIES: DUF2157 domain-containing protein [unclassified Pseudidiomarina]MDN7125344.1 DUF2157 domain-containing protein [Pseudidiomarina sp. 1APP75-32.1]MDN7130102.1 DUF2157 domain-containing protein [Pseudidiomarina sp. 1APR75-15]